MWITSSLQLLPGPLLPRMVVPFRVPSIGYIELFNHLLWIIMGYFELFKLDRNTW